MFFVYLLNLEYPDCHQNVISSSSYFPGPLHKISSQYAPILPTVKMLSLGGERLSPPQKKSFGSLHAPRSGYATTIMVFVFAHLLIIEYPDRHQNLISSLLYYPGLLHKISSQYVHNFVSNDVPKQTNRQTNKQTNATKNITSFAKEVSQGGNKQAHRQTNQRYQKHNLLCHEVVKTEREYRKEVVPGY